jgi:hypothetical protein
MHKFGFVPPQPSGIQEKKHMQIDCAQCYQSGSNPIKMTDNWHCFAKVSKTFHEIVRRQESLGVNESQVRRPKSFRRVGANALRKHGSCGRSRRCNARVELIDERQFGRSISRQCR